MARGYVPRRGDVHFNPQTRHEQFGRRPAVVLSPEGYNQKTSLALFCPVTSQVKGYPFETVLPTSGSLRGAHGTPIYIWRDGKVVAEKP